MKARVVLGNGRGAFLVDDIAEWRVGEQNELNLYRQTIIPGFNLFSRPPPFIFMTISSTDWCAIEVAD